MGGSSLAPIVLHDTFGGPLKVLDTTHPATVRQTFKSAGNSSFAVIASKSGTTLEPNAMLAAWRAIHSDPSGLGAITDPGTPLDSLATQDKFAFCWENQPDIGGRYSALSYFGLLPAALAGIDVASILSFDETEIQLGVELGIEIAERVTEGKNKLTILAASPIATIGLWIEQLFAESTGKLGKGVVPVAGELIGEAESYGNDRLFLSISCGNFNVRAPSTQHPELQLRIDDPSEIGLVMFQLEVATAVCGSLLDIDPFDEPDVATAKAATSRILEQKQTDFGALAKPGDVTSWLTQQVEPHDYVVLGAYLPYEKPIDDALQTLQGAIRNRMGIATTRGFGPRYLHSTGQLHKGGPNQINMVQLLAGASADGHTDDFPIPGCDFGFAQLIAAQALGDYEILTHRSRHVIRVDLGADPAAAILEIAGTLT